MHSIDRILIDPEDEALADAVHEAVAAVDRDMHGQGYSLSQRLDLRAAVPRLAGQMQQEPEGVCEWRIPGPGPNGVRAALIAVWWSDFFERRHLRLLGGCEHRGMELPLPIPSVHRPALACVYPEVCVVASQHRRPRLLTVCECGAWGEPKKLAWMGPTCGPCWDRSEADTAVRRVTLEVGPAVHALTFAPDGRLAIWDERGVRLWDADLRPKVVDGRWAATPGCKLQISPDGAFLGGLDREQELVIFPILTDRSIVFEPAGAFAFLCEPGQFIARFNDPPQLMRCDPRYDRPNFQGEEGVYEVSYSEFRQPFPLECHDLAVSPDGRVVAAACGRQGLCFWDAYTGEPLDRSPESDCTGPLLWSPDGSALACGVEAVHWKAILYDFYARRRRAVIGGTDPLHALAFTPDGRWLLTCERNVLRAWDVETGTERYGVAPAGEQPYALTLSPDGETAALAVRGGRVKLWPTRLLLPEG